MPDFGTTFGSEAGWTFGEQSARNNIVSALDAQQRTENVKFDKQMNPMLQQMQQMKIQQAQRQIAQQQHFAALMSGDVTRYLTSARPSDAMIMTARLHLLSGNSDLFEAGLKEASAAQEKEAKIDKDIVERDVKMLQMQQDKQSWIVSALSEVKDDETWKTGVETARERSLKLAQSDKERTSVNQWADQLAAMPYDKGYVERLRNSVLSVLDQNKKTQEAITNAFKERETKSLEALRSAQEERNRAQAKADKALADWREKHGDKGAAEPPQTAVDNARALISGEFPEMTDKEAISRGAHNIASRAVQMRDEPEYARLNADDRLRRALAEAIKNGEFPEVSKPGLKIFGVQTGVGETKERKFVHGAGEGTKASPMNRKEVKNEGELKAGTWYTDDKGDYELQWLGTGWGPPVKVEKK